MLDRHVLFDWLATEDLTWKWGLDKRAASSFTSSLQSCNIGSLNNSRQRERINQLKTRIQSNTFIRMQMQSQIFCFSLLRVQARQRSERNPSGGNKKKKTLKFRFWLQWRILMLLFPIPLQLASLYLMLIICLCYCFVSFWTTVTE